MTIKIFNPRHTPYGMLSNNAYYPIEIKGKKYRSVTHYIYSYLLCEGTYQNLVRNQKNAVSAVKMYQNVKSECKKLETKNALYIAYKYKVKNDSLFKEVLLKTKKKNLIYQSSNRLLGMESGKGLNLIGKTLEEIRHELLIEKMKKQRVDNETQINENIYKIFMVIDALDNLMRINENDLKEFENMTYHDILTEGNLLEKQYVHKEVVIENYQKGRLQHRNIIEMILKYPNTTEISKIFRKYNLRNLYESLKRRKENIVFNYYLQDLIRKNYPALPNDEISHALNQQLQKLSLERINELKHDVNLKYRRGKIDVNDLEVLEQKVKELEEKTPTIQEVEQVETYVFDPLYEDKKVDIVKDDVEEENPEIYQQHNQKQSQLEMFLENLQEDEDENDNEIMEQIDIIEELPDETFENDKEIVFDKNTDGKYGTLSPMYQTWIFLNGLDYPTVSHYLFADSFRNIIIKMKGKKNAWILAHNLITLNDVDEEKYKSVKNIEFYIDLGNFNWRQIENIIICEVKKKLFEEIAIRKFSNLEMEQLLSLTGSQQIVYTDKNDSCLGLGQLENGDNYTGKWLEKKRAEITDDIKREAKQNADIILLSQMLNNDEKLNNWIFERARDIVHTLVLIANNKIDEKLVDFTIDKLYFPCRAMEISKVYTEVPGSFGKRLVEYIKFYKGEYSIDPKVHISRNAISKIWKYVSLLSYNLLRQANKSGEMPYIYLTEAQHGLSTDCKIESIKCIVSAVQHIDKILKGFDHKLNLKLEQVIGGILHGRPIKVVKGKQQPIKEFKNTRLSDLSYTILRKTRQQDGFRVINRVNFFKSLEPVFLGDEEEDDEMFQNIEEQNKKQMADALKFLEEM
jgi:predicted NAD-dependent protein-ADP-ribosyltransferase YbiA (DUF1768 family)